MRICRYIVINDNWFSFKLYKNKVKTWIKETGKYVLVCFVIGAIVDVFVKRGFHCFIVKNLDNYCLSLIQIQATMTTLIIATIALLSGIMTKSYLGISLCSFILDIRPKFKVFKFKNILINEFILLGLAIISYIFGCYNTVIILCIYSIFILPIFIRNIYDVFVSTNNILRDIRNHYLYLVKEDRNYENIGHKFIDDWKKAIVIKQAKDEYNDYFQLFMKLIIRIISKEKDLKTLNIFSEIVANFLLSSDNYQTKLKGVIFVFDFYREINKWLNNNFNIANNIRSQVSLLSDVFRTWWEVIDSLETEDIEKLKFRILIKDVLETAIILRSKEMDDVPDIDNLQNMAGLFGLLLDKQYKKGKSVNISYWRKLIVNNHLEYVCCNKDLSAKSKEEYYKSLAKINFIVCKSYLIRGYIDYINTAVFSDWSGYITILEYDIDKREAIIFEMMLIHCFMYYLACRESSPHVNINLQQKVKKLIKDKNIINKIHSFYYTIVVQHSNYLSVTLGQKLEKTLDQHELFDCSEGGGSKILTMQVAVQDYYLYISLFAKIYSLNVFDLSEHLDVNKYYSYLFDSSRKSVRSHLCELHRLFNDNYSDSQLDSMIDSMLNIFDKEMKNKLKRKKILDAALKYKEFDVCNAKERIKNTLARYFHSFFDENNSNCITDSDQYFF